MKRSFLTVVAALLLALSMSIGGASAAKNEPGTPGEKNCKGQTIAFLAQGAAGDLESRGLGNIAADNSLTVQEVHEIVEEFCAG